MKSFALQGERIGQIETPFGESQAIFKIDAEHGSFLFLSRHGEKGYSKTASYVNYRANIYALKEHGIKQIVSWSGPGAINPEYKIGQYVMSPIMRRALLTVNTGLENFLRVFHQTTIEKPLQTVSADFQSLLKR